MNARNTARNAAFSYIVRICGAATAISGCSNGDIGTADSNLAGGDDPQLEKTAGNDGATAPLTLASRVRWARRHPPGAGGANGAGGAANDAGGSGAGGANGASGGNAASGGQPSANGAGGSSNPSSTALVNPAPGSKLFLGANFWNIDWEGQDDFFTSGVDFATTDNPWQPALLASLAPYHVLRFMDWNMTNFSNNPQANWSTRKQKTDVQNEPIAFEWQIDLCNRTKKDLWVNIPHEAGPEMWTALAQLVHAQLDPSLRVYVEWSNEVWNSGFPVRAYATQKAQELGLPGGDPAFAYQTYESVRVFEAFEQVFGKNNPHVVKVIAGQTANRGVCDKLVEALAEPSINPNGTQADAYAGAPYFSGSTIQELSDAIPETVGWTTSSLQCTTGGNLPLISYEGGSDSYAAGNAGCAALQSDPAMRGLYTKYLTDHATAGLKGPFMQYTHVGECWGLKAKTSDSDAASPKYQGMLDWIEANP